LRSRRERTSGDRSAQQNIVLDAVDRFGAKNRDSINIGELMAWHVMLAQTRYQGRLAFKFIATMQSGGRESSKQIIMFAHNTQILVDPVPDHPHRSRRDVKPAGNECFEVGHVKVQPYSFLIAEKADSIGSRLLLRK
jgi:hypothetical protein